MEDQLLSGCSRTPATRRLTDLGQRRWTKEREKMTPPNPPSELLVYCFRWLCLVGHIPSICTDLTALTEGNHVRLMTEDQFYVPSGGGDTFA